MILVLVLVFPRVGAGGWSWLGRVASFSGPLLGSISGLVRCGDRVCAGG